MNNAASGYPDLDAGEYRRRVSALQVAMVMEGVGSALIHAPSNVLYFCGFETVSTGTYACLVVHAAGEPTLVVWALELAGAEMTATAGSIVTYPTGADPLDATLAAAGTGGGRIAIELDAAALPPRMYAILTARRGEPADAGPMIATVRRIKSDAEIGCFRQAARHTDAAMAAAITAAGAGANDNAMAAAALQAMVAGGGEYSSMPPIVSAGRQSGIAHSTFRNIKLVAGDAVVIELGGCVRRYCTPLMRTVSIGAPLAPVADLYARASAVLGCVLDELRPGRVGDEIAEAAWAVLGDLGDIMFHGVFAYALGPGFPPSWADGTLRIRRTAMDIIEPGMVLHLPIAFRRPGICGVSVSETVVVTATGAEPLSTLDRDLAVR